MPSRALAFGGFVFALTFARASSADCLTESELARSAMRDRNLLRARAALRGCAQDECDEAVRSTCDAYLAEVNERLPSIVFEVKDAAGRDLIAVIAIDGVPSTEPVGAALTLDPGPHTFVFDAPGLPPEERTFVLLERQRGRRELVVLGPPVEPRSATPAPRPAGASRWRTVGYIGLGASAVALGIGTAFGIDAILKNERAGCDDASFCDDPAARSAARDAATVSTVGFVAAGVFALASVVVLALEGSDIRRSLARW